MPPATTRSRPPRAPLTGMLWFGARVSLALRRTRRFVRWWLAIGGSLTVVALLLPVATQPKGSDFAAQLAQAVADSTRTSAQLARAAARAATADSLAAAQVASSVAPSAPRVAAVTPTSTLAAAITAARAERARDAVLALSNHPLLAGGPRMRATADSFRIAPTPSEAYRLSGTILAMAEYRLANLGGSVQAAPPPVSARIDTAEYNAIARAERDTLAAAERAHEEARRAVEAVTQAAAAERAAVPLVSPGLALLVLVLAGLAARLTLAVLRELREPTIAHPLEAERAVGAPALSLVRDALPDGPLRFRPSGVDPFRVLYLHLTSTGTRTRTVIVTGEDAAIVAAVGARLAIAAAADHRTTLVAEWDTEQVALARIFRDHPEPGVSDALSGSFKWREVARSVGSSDGLSIVMLPAGTTRGAIDAAQRETALADFQRFREGFELTIVAVTLRDLADARSLVPNAPVVLCAAVGVTSLAALHSGAAAVEASEPIHSLVLWDAPRPGLISRAELAAWLSKRKGRTPGGSFKAVQEAINKPPTGQ